VRGEELTEKLGRNDLCPCGSNRRFQTLLPAGRPFSTAQSATTTDATETGRGGGSCRRPVSSRRPAARLGAEVPRLDPRLLGIGPGRRRTVRQRRALTSNRPNGRRQEGATDPMHSPYASQWALPQTKYLSRTWESSAGRLVIPQQGRSEPASPYRPAVPAALGHRGMDIEGPGSAWLRRFRRRPIRRFPWAGTGPSA
jgi:hypothetical protein